MPEENAQPQVDEKTEEAKPLLHLGLLLGLVVGVCASHAYRHGFAGQSLASSLAEVAGSFFGLLVVASLMTLLLPKSWSFMVFYSVSYFALTGLFFAK